MKLFQKVSRTWKLILECVPIKSYSLIRPREMFNMYIFLRKTDFWGWTEDEEMIAVSISDSVLRMVLKLFWDMILEALLAAFDSFE